MHHVAQNFPVSGLKAAKFLHLLLHILPIVSNRN
uniref:Uncharacterized protein n=1 Tax=Rhizophora mucronata TaxID=61149 RepID=A0A2P2PCY8_RHIMU